MTGARRRADARPGRPLSDRRQLLEALGRQPQLAALPAGDRERLADLAQFATRPRGALLIEEGAAVSSLWILVEGSVEVGLGAARTPVAELGPGSLLGEGSYLSGRPASASVTTLDDCRLVEIPHADLRSACEEHPSFGLRVERLLVAVFAERLSRSVAQGARADLPLVDAESLKSLRTLELQPIEEEAIARYARFGKRDPFLWRWCLRALELTTLPVVPEPSRLDARATKFLAAVTLVTVDGVADLGRSSEDLEAVLALLDAAPSADGAVVGNTPLHEELSWLWSALDERARRLPEYAGLAAVLTFDWRMVFTANRHARLARDIQAVVNPTENLEYAPHGIAMMVFGTLDLMSSSRPALADVRATRELVHAGQVLCELANMIATWRREIPTATSAVASSRSASRVERSPWRSCTRSRPTRSSTASRRPGSRSC